MEDVLKGSNSPQCTKLHDRQFFSILYCVDSLKPQYSPRYLITSITITTTTTITD
jgi:hypothetical protein